MKLSGTIINGNNAAAGRFKTTREVLRKYGLSFPPLYFDTINIQIIEYFKTPYYDIINPHHELDEISRKNNEYWQFIPIVRINDKNIIGYILRTSINIHVEKVIELVTENNYEQAKLGNLIEIEIYD
jgi:hypothetical protein